MMQQVPEIGVPQGTRRVSTHALLSMAEKWARTAGSSLLFWPMNHSESVQLVSLGKGAELLSCALELRQMLASAPDFRQAICDLALEPIDDGRF